MYYRNQVAVTPFQVYMYSIVTANNNLCFCVVTFIAFLCSFIALIYHLYLYKSIVDMLYYWRKTNIYTYFLFLYSDWLKPVSDVNLTPGVDLSNVSSVYKVSDLNVVNIQMTFTVLSI